MRCYSHYIPPPRDTARSHSIAEFESGDISICVIVFDNRIMSTAIIGIYDIKFGQAKIPCKIAALVNCRERAGSCAACLINKANSYRLMVFCGERALTNGEEITLSG